MFKRKREGDIVQRHSEVARAERLMYSPCIKYGRAATDGHYPSTPLETHKHWRSSQHIRTCPSSQAFALLAV